MMPKKRKSNPPKSKVKLGDQTIRVSHLHLDLANYRHEEVENEAQAIATLCKTELIVELARDIANRGRLSPLNNLGAIPMEGAPGHFVSVEGNRRTCALLVATDPSRAPKHLQSKLERIAAKRYLPQEIKVHVFANKAEAKQWIDLRHLGPQGGAGVKPWNATQKNRAARGNTNTSANANTLAVLALDRLVALGLLNQEQRNKVAVSTITRYLGSPAVRAIFGLASRDELLYTHDPDEVDYALQRLALDSITPQRDGTFAVNSRSNSTERTRYANELKTQGATPSTPLQTPTPPPDTGKTGNERNQTTKKKRSAINPDKRKYLISRDFVVSFKDNVLLRLRTEGMQLDVENFSFSANFLLRALVERILIRFLKKRERWNDKLTDQALTQACAEELKILGADRAVYSVVNKAGSNMATPYSLHSLGHTVHGGSVPTGRDLKKHFETWRPALEAMLDYLSGK